VLSLNSATAAGYRDIINAVSSVFSEETSVDSDANLHAILSPTGGDRRAHAQAQLMLAWLQFASGAVAWDATVPLGGGEAVGFLDLMSAAEQTILDPAASKSELAAVERDLASVRHAF